MGKFIKVLVLVSLSVIATLKIEASIPAAKHAVGGVLVAAAHGARAVELAALRAAERVEPEAPCLALVD